MRHGKDTFKIGRTASHRRCMIANMLKALIEHGRIETTERKAKELRRHADHMVTLAKKNTLSSRRRAIAELMISYNTLSSKEARTAKKGEADHRNTDRKVVGKLFGELAQRFATRNGGFTRIIKKDFRIGDNAPSVYIEYLAQ
jgi:large subunit ribosomal protein L17